jgi:fructan beta-fructosidase
LCRGYAVDAVDTTAAGDAFMASLMSGLLGIGLDAGSDQMLGILRASCAAGALATTRKGAMESMPTAEEIAQLLATQPENHS